MVDVETEMAHVNNIISGRKCELDMIMMNERNF